jgi:uncharacterized protein YggU (UPF0235/DUF167 family)
MPMDRKFEITDARRGTALTVRVVTNAPRAEFGGVLEDGVIKVRLTARGAGEPAANAELLDFLAVQLGVTAAQMEVVAGAAERDKIVSIEDVSSEQIEAALQRAGL